jgi:hypothetical protein
MTAFFAVLSSDQIKSMQLHFFTVCPLCPYQCTVHPQPQNAVNCYVSKKQSRPHTVPRKSCSVGIAGLLMESLTVLGVGGGEGVLVDCGSCTQKTFLVLNSTSFNI